MKLVSGRWHPDSSVVAVGVFTGESLPSDPAAVVIHGRDSVVVEDGAHQVRADRGSVRPGLQGIELPSIHRAAVHPDARIEPLGGRVVETRPPRRAFIGASRLAVSPDYGGVMFRTSLGMADVDVLSHRIEPSLQSDLWQWYLEWDESTTTKRWSWDEFQDEGTRLVDALNTSLAGECSFTLEL